MSNALNLTATIGGRVVTPALPTVDSSPSPPTEVEFSATLSSYIATNVPLEPVEGIQRRERVLVKMAGLCREWVKSVARKRGWGEEVVDRAGGELFTSGSYRLGVHEPGADIGEFFWIWIV
jgi:poly(A) polymerase